MNVQSQLYAISLMTEEFRNEYEMLNYYMWQNMGESKHSAILSSLLHYLLNRKFTHQIEHFLNAQLKQTQSQQISKILAESLKTQVPIQFFFQELQKFDQNIEMTEIMLDDFCRLYRFIDQNKICIDKLASFFDLTIILLPNINFGKGKNILHIYLVDEIYYFLIPSIIKQNRIRCNTCENKIEAYFELICQHYVCYNCMKKAQGRYFVCKCGRIEEQFTVQQILEDALKIHQNKIYTKALENYYNGIQEENQDDQLLSASEASDSYHNESLHEIQDIVDECYQCEKQSLTKFFVVKECKHQFCFDCISKEFEKEECGGCFCLACSATITRLEYEYYLQEIKDVMRNQIKNQCSTCGKSFDEELFNPIGCEHKYCDECIQGVFSRNYFREFICSVRSCQNIYSKQDYQNFKMQIVRNQQQSILPNDAQQQNLQITQSQINYSNISKSEWSHSFEQPIVSQQFSQYQLNQFMNNNTNFIVSEIYDPSQQNQCIPESSIIPSSRIGLSYHLSSIVYCDKCKQLDKALFEVEGCSHRFCRDCLQVSYSASSIFKDIYCLDSNCRNKLCNQYVDQFLNGERQNNLDEILARRNCDCCNVEGDQNFLVNECYHKFCLNCLNKDIVDVQGDMINCLAENCRSVFEKKEYYSFYDSVFVESPLTGQSTQTQTAQSTEQTQQTIQPSNTLSPKPPEEVKQNTQSVNDGLKIKLRSEFKINQNQQFQQKSQIKSSLKTREPCDFCNMYTSTQFLFQIKCKHKICSKCACFLTKQNTRCKKCITNFVDDVNFQRFKFSLQLMCEVCQLSYQQEEMFLKTQCRHLLCYNCVYPLFFHNKRFACLIKDCNKSFNTEGFVQFCQKFEVEGQEAIEYSEIYQKPQLILDQPKPQIIQEPKQLIISMPKPQIINIPKPQIVQKPKESVIININLNSSQCSQCFSEFSDYNRKQDIDCKLHYIGVCCLWKNFRRCPQCEIPYRNIKNKISLK